LIIKKALFVRVKIITTINIRELVDSRLNTIRYAKLKHLKSFGYKLSKIKRSKYINILILKLKSDIKWILKFLKWIKFYLW
jgi:hypothetical protein